MTLEQLEIFGSQVANWQRGVNWWIGDVARYAEARFPGKWQQAFPEWMSPGLIQRCKAVAAAYPTPEDRNINATWSQHMQVANRPERIALVAAMVDKGQTTDESRAAPPTSPRWLLAVDVNYFLHRFWFSGAGVEAAASVAQWLQRTVARLKGKGLTDCVCCFDSPTNFRKDLTKDWEDKYKDRPPKEQELVQQLHLVRSLLEGHGLACVSVDGMEADDCMASYAARFPGKVTILTQDKDCRQCLSDRVNMLLDVEWVEDETSGDAIPDYKWLSASQHTEATGVPPARWVDYQCIMGDNTDGIRGVEGVGQKGAADLVAAFGSVESVIAAAKAGDASVTAKKREALIAFEGKLDVTRRLVTLRTDLDVPMATRLT